MTERVLKEHDMTINYQIEEEWWRYADPEYERRPHLQTPLKNVSWLTKIPVRSNSSQGTIRLASLDSLIV